MNRDERLGAVEVVRTERLQKGEDDLVVQVLALGSAQGIAQREQHRRERREEEDGPHRRRRAPMLRDERLDARRSLVGRDRLVGNEHDRSRRGRERPQGWLARAGVGVDELMRLASF